MHKKIIIIAALIATTFLVNGCLQYEIGTELKADGSGTRNITLGVDPKYQKIIEDAEEKSLSSIIKESLPDKAELSSEKKGKTTNYKISIPFKDIGNENFFQLNPQDGVESKVNFSKIDNLFYIDYKLEETIDLSYQLNFQTELPLNLSKDKIQEINARYWIKMPGKISQANTKDISGDIGVWKLNFGQKHQVEVKSRVYRYSVILIFLLILISGLVGGGAFYIYLRSP